MIQAYLDFNKNVYSWFQVQLLLMTRGNQKKAKGFNGPPTARSEPGRDHLC